MYKGIDTDDIISRINATAEKRQNEELKHKQDKLRLLKDNISHIERDFKSDAIALVRVFDAIRYHRESIGFSPFGDHIGAGIMRYGCDRVGFLGFRECPDADGARAASVGIVARGSGSADNVSLVFRPLDFEGRVEYGNGFGLPIGCAADEIAIHEEQFIKTGELDAWLEAMAQVAGMFVWKFDDFVRDYLCYVNQHLMK